jgi:hypothetical protein
VAETATNPELPDLGTFTLTPSQVQSYLDYALPLGDTAFIHGFFGIGKTAIVREFCRKNRLRCVAIHLPQFDPSDLKGIPVRLDDGSIKWLPSSYLPQMASVVLGDAMLNDAQRAVRIPWKAPYALPDMVYVRIIDPNGNVVFQQNVPFENDVVPKQGGVSVEIDSGLVQNQVGVSCDPKLFKDHRFEIGERAVLFLDELTAAVQQVQNTALPLVLEGVLNEYRVPYNCRVVAAGNRDSDLAAVHRLTGPLANRFRHITMRADLADFLAYAEGRLHPAILGFMRGLGSQHLAAFDKDEFRKGDYGVATPRAWEKLSPLLSHKVDPTIMSAIIIGGLGRIVGWSFSGYFTMMGDLPSPEEIFEGTARKIDKIPNRNIALDWGVAYTMAAALKTEFDLFQSKKTTKEDWIRRSNNLLKYMMGNLGKEIVIYWISLTRRVYGVGMGEFRECECFQEFAKTHAEVMNRAL